MKATVIGQGYVGLPLAVAAAKYTNKVFGLDTNLEKIAKLSEGLSTIEDLADSEIQVALKSGNYFPTSDYSVVADSDIVLICVPTPLTKDRKPDLTILIDSVKMVGKQIKKNTLIIVESTIQPTTCREILIPLLISESGLEVDEFYFAYSPERVDPRNKKWKISNTPKLVSGYSDEALQKAVEFYEKFIQPIIKCESLEIAETAKLLENAFRLVNISFINEIADFCAKIGVNVIQVIDAAATKPYGFMPFYPGLGAGGHCIPVDPLYLQNAAIGINSKIKFIELAETINNGRADYFVDLAIKNLGNLTGKKILIVGVSYKPNVSDVRETPVAGLITGLRQKGAQVLWHDDLVKEWAGEKSSLLSEEYDLAIIATAHDYLDLHKLGDTPILNTRGSGN
jgi:UDP-N-acetyl-D-glucosamine dehydrogenase